MFKRFLTKFLKPYRVVVQGGDFDGASHRSAHLADALEWMACYPNNCQVFVFVDGPLMCANEVVLFRQGRK